MSFRHALFFFALTAACAAPRANAPSDGKESGGGHALPFIDDDYSRALVEAQNRSRPIFVETWAPW